MSNLELFSPSVWPATLPSVVWKGWRLTPVRADRAELDLSGTPLADALKVCFPQAGFASLARLSELFPEDSDELFQAYGLRWSDRLALLCSAFNSAPVAFKQWCEDRRVSPRDLYPLLSLNSVSAAAEILDFVASNRLTRAEGVAALETAIELVLMGRPVEELLRFDGEWKDHLRALRRPMESADDRAREDQRKIWPWPSETTGHWIRGGDRPNLEIRLNAASPADLERKLDRLRDIANAWHGLDAR